VSDSCVQPATERLHGKRWCTNSRRTPLRMTDGWASSTPVCEREATLFSGKTIFITGGTGSFGNAVLSRLLDTGVREIRVFSRDEKKQEDARLHYGSSKLKFYIGDVRAYESVAAAMAGSDYVFNAAALKQVPSCEFFPLEALRTNALGAENVLSAALATGVKRVIVLSTDKAVYPINAMGITKALMEKLMIAKARQCEGRDTVLCGTRYGNVMASRGSVIPLLVNQIKAGRPLTVTDPHMTRFMMSIEDAVDLVLYAYEHGTPGDIFVQKAPAATIATLAEALKRIFDVNNPVTYIGTRHGEKLYETLLTREEMARAEDLGQYFRIPADHRNLNYNVYFSEGQQRVSSAEDYTSHSTTRLDVAALVQLLSNLAYIQKELATWRR
jgi:UDP-N-acetylglucosamine 4,6-dehydratase/5-epimerase